MKRGWIVGGWLFAMIASALPALWFTAQRIQRNPLGIYVDPLTGAWTHEVYWRFLAWWLPIAAPVSLLAAAFMVLNWPTKRR